MNNRKYRSLFLAACLAFTPWSAEAEHGAPDRAERGCPDQTEHGAPDRIAALETALATLQAAQAQQSAQIVNLTANLAAANARVVELESALGDLASSSVLQLEPFVKVQTAAINGLSGPHIIFEGVNVHVRNGSGRSDNGVGMEMSGNGLGNLIVGYNEWTRSDDPALGRTGSHCLVVGPEHSYRSPVGIVAGYGNTLVEGCASILGGSNNSATSGSSILGGYTNTTTAVRYPGWHFTHQCISGGANNTVNNWADTISGGMGNTVDGGSISGGLNNTILGWGGSISGGENNTANGYCTSISGGANNSTSANNSSVSGGSNRQALGQDDWVAGALWQDN